MNDRYNPSWIENLVLKSKEDYKQRFGFYPSVICLNRDAARALCECKSFRDLVRSHPAGLKPDKFFELCQVLNYFDEFRMLGCKVKLDGDYVRFTLESATNRPAGQYPYAPAQHIVVGTVNPIRLEPRYED